jgi:hypothetical protein
MSKLKFIKEVEILSSNFSVTWDKTSDGGSFSWSENSITVGIKNYKKDPLYTMSILSHEIMEVILTGLGARFNNTRTMDNYLFSFCHQTFENAIQIHIQALNKFIDYKV